MTFALHGIGVSRGVAIGRALCLDTGGAEVSHRIVSPSERPIERQRLLDAIAAVRDEFMHLRRHIPGDAPPELAALLQVHEMILQDPALSSRPLTLIDERGMNAEWALRETADALVAQFEAMSDSYLRERKSDVQQVVARVRRAMALASSADNAYSPLFGLSGLVAHSIAASTNHAVVANGNAHPSMTPSLPVDGLAHDESFGHAVPRILVASDLAPADMLQMRNDQEDAPRIAAFCTALGGHASHTAILARSMNVPAVVGIHGVTDRIVDNDWIVIDGDAGVVVVSPDEQVLAHYRAKLQAQADEREALDIIRGHAAVTHDGRTVTLLANIEMPDDAELALQANAAGIGLFRSEFLFMNRSHLPGEEEQFAAYCKAVLAMHGRPVTIRTLDVGADKTLQNKPHGHADAASHAPAENPALGLRAIRYSLAEPVMFQTQLRAILRASAFGPVRLLIPMLSAPSEIDAVLQHVAIAKADLAERGQAFDAHVPIGGMIEIPAAALSVAAFTQRLDFLSIGTNDLIQYTLAIDRADVEVAALYDPLHPAVLHLIAHTLREAARASCEVSVCGEMAGDPQFTHLLIGMGLTHFSMQASQLPYVKQAILSADYARAKKLADGVLAESDARVIRQRLAEYAAITATDAVYERPMR